MQPAAAEQLVRLTQHALDDSNDFPPHHLRLALSDNSQYTADFGNQDGTGAYGFEAMSLLRRDYNDATALTVRLQSSEEATTATAQLRPNSFILDVVHPVHMIPHHPTGPSALGTFIATQLHELFGEERDMLRQLISVPGQGSQSRTQTQDPLSLNKRSNRMAKYAPVYHLTFSLFTSGPSPAAWDIRAALEQNLRPLLSALAPISNFTIDTQVQPYAAFSPSVQPTYSEEQNAWIIPRAELGGFINAAEWPLSPGIGAGPTINFVLYVAGQDQSPLLIQESTTNSWIIPQWGGVLIFNPPNGNRTKLSASDLQPALITFASQLLSLLGLPSTPASSLPLRLSVLARIRAADLLLSASSSLGSLARLVAALPSISIPDSVAESVSATLGHLEAACHNFEEGQFQEALQNGRIADEKAQKAFFERSMVGQVYFPDEHKVAVYLPLLGPMAVPLFMSAVWEILPFIKTLKTRARNRPA